MGGRKKRRRWTSEEKLRIVLAVATDRPGDELRTVVAANVLRHVSIDQSGFRTGS